MAERANSFNEDASLDENGSEELNVNGRESDEENERRMTELKTMKTGAEGMARSKDMVVFKWLYRNKPKAYWDEVKQHGCETFIENDWGMNQRNLGHAYCASLYAADSYKYRDNLADMGAIYNYNRGQFGQDIYDYRLPDISPYGETRFLISPAKLIKLEKTNLYFKAFYLSKSNNYHVVLFACDKDSESSTFCGRNFLPIDLSDNPFLCFTGSEFKVSGTPKLWVDLHWMGSITLEDGHFDSGYYDEDRACFVGFSPKFTPRRTNT